MSLFLLNKREPPRSNQIRFRDPLTAFQAELSLHCPQGFPPRRDALQRIKDQIAAALQSRCIATGASDDGHNQHLPSEIRSQVIDLIEAWWKLTQQPEAKLQYWTYEDKGAGAGLLHTPLDTDQLYAGEGYKQFTTNWSLPDVEPSAPIRLVNFREEITTDE